MADSPLVAGIRDRFDSLTPNERHVAETLLGEGESLIYRSASEMADRAGVALSTVVRTCQSLGFKGFQDLKLSLAREGRPATAQEIQGDVAPEDPPTVVLEKLTRAAGEAVEAGIRHVAPEAFESAVQSLVGVRRLLCLGLGTSAPLAQDAAYRFRWIGLDAHAPADVHDQHLRAATLQPGDVALVVSHTGSTRETVIATQAAADAGAEIIAVSSFPRTPLSRLATIMLVAASQETSYRIEAMASRIAHLVVIDALWAATAVRIGDDALKSMRRTADLLSDHRY